MSKFVGKELKSIDLWDSEWVKIPVALSFEEVTNLTKETDHIELSKKMLVRFITEWNIKDEDNVIPEINEKNIMRLDIKTINIITDEITKIMSPETTKEDYKKK